MPREPGSASGSDVAAEGAVGEPTLFGEVGEGPAARRFVEVAIDAAGGGGSRTYTYHVPDRLADVEAGEAVLVEYGRRQALAVVLGDVVAPPAPGIATKPLLERVRADGPLLPPLALALARWISATYLAPPALVLRAMLPPGFLERLELVAEALPADAEEEPTEPGGRRDALLEQLDPGPKAVRDLASPDGRGALIRRLRTLERDGRISLEWTLLGAAGGPRFERWVRLTPAGAAVGGSDTDAPPPRPTARLGPRQQALLRELADTAGPDGIRATDLAARHGSSTLPSLVRRGLVDVEVRQRERLALARRARGTRGARPAGADLFPEQADAVEAITGAIEARDPTPILLDGVTGAGKTAVYVEAIAASLEAGRPALILVPEIALSLPLVDRLRADLDVTVSLVHSGLSVGERADEWRRIRSGAVDLIAGTRLAVLAPLTDVGVVIVDEEHEAAYKSDRTPRLQARDAAVELGRQAGAPVILGSATPAVESVGRARDGRYGRFALPARPTGREPDIELVDLRAELAVGNRGLLSATLFEALRDLDRGAGERAILVINRRGAASVVLCRDCGYVQECPECGRPLVFHQAGMTLRCHHCGTAAPAATRCPKCGSPRIRFLGGGTERVEREVRERLPGYRVGRLDRDVVEHKGAAERVLDAFRDGRLDVLVGTSLVAKGLDVPEVTVVGVVSADVALNLPDERATERTYQLLTQAVGRAGRGERPGRAFIQTYQPDHPAIQAVVERDANAFYDAELERRRIFGSPPFGRLVKLTVGLEEASAAESAAHEMADRLRARAKERGSDTVVVGPAPAYVARRAGRWRWNILLRGSAPTALLDGGLDAPWSVDVDPDSTL
jgi:primosomal protein N' (replication factor Y)